jgi:type II secretory pathway pseudopilin PulG
MMRSAFSLLEIIIATAVLAASAMVLSSLIGLGAKYGNRAEERTIAVSQAESLMDEFLAQLDNENIQVEESTGELPGPPPRGFRVSAIPFEVTNANSNDGSGVNVAKRSGGLLRVTVEVFETSGSNDLSGTKPLIELSRLIRQPQMAPRGFDPSVQGAIP